MHIKILGSAAGGGFPQWNCVCPNCRRFRFGVFKGPTRTQSQIAVSSIPSKWFFVNASPDLRQQLLADAEFAPSGTPRGTPIAALILTSADVDCVMGLLHLREFQPLHIYSTASVKRILTEENTLFRVLERSHPPVLWDDLPLDRPISIYQHASLVPESTLSCRAVPLGGSFPDYVSDRLRRSLPAEEATIGLEFIQDGKRLFYAPSLPGRTANWRAHAAESHLSLLDGTFWTDDELADLLGSGKTAREMGHQPLSGQDGLLEQLRDARNTRRVLIHLNNTNPALDEESQANRTLRDAGWEIAYDGMEIEL